MNTWFNKVRVGELKQEQHERQNISMVQLKLLQSSRY